MKTKCCRHWSNKYKYASSYCIKVAIAHWYVLLPDRIKSWLLECCVQWWGFQGSCTGGEQVWCPSYWHVCPLQNNTNEPYYYGKSPRWDLKVKPHVNTLSQLLSYASGHVGFVVTARSLFSFFFFFFRVIDFKVINNKTYVIRIVFSVFTVSQLTIQPVLISLMSQREIPWFQEPWSQLGMCSLARDGWAARETRGMWGAERRPNRVKGQGREEEIKKCLCRMLVGVLSGHILCIFLISFYGPLAELELLQLMENVSDNNKAF